MPKFSPQQLLIGIGVLLIGGALWYSLSTGGAQDIPTGSETAQNPNDTTEAAAPDESDSVAQPSSGQGSTGTASSKPASGQPKPTPTNPSPAVPTPEPTPTPVPNNPDQTPAPAPMPAPAPYDPGFLATSRITPEIPSQNERATLPACGDKRFTLEPVNLGAVSSIRATGSYAVLSFSSTGEFAKYDITAPADVWITHIAQETGISADPEDSTVYFALCRDVIGYVTHVKELSAPIYKFVTDSSCLGKPHTGANACHVRVLDLVGKGSPLGKAGRIEGSLGFGVIDLRTQTNFTAPETQPVRVNFAACPFSYFSNPSGFFNKLASGATLCSAP